jgi:uncharacterized protein (TIGR02453 family)
MAPKESAMTITFPPAGIQFLRDLAHNNTKTWFEAHKEAYLTDVQQPAVQLVTALGQRLQAAFPTIDYDPRPNGGSLMRIYRDTRFSKDKTPYKTNVAMMFMPKGNKRMEAPGFGLQITPEQVESMAGLFAFGPQQLDLYRAAVLHDQTGAALVDIAARVLSNNGYQIGGKDLKQVPRGYAADHPRAEWLKYKGLHVYSPAIPLEVAHSAAFVDVVMQHFHVMAPLQVWLAQVLQEAQ